MVKKPNKALTRPLRLLLVGFGNVGRTLASILTRERQRFAGLQHVNWQVIGIVTRKHGALVNAKGIDLERALVQIEQGAFSAAHPDFKPMLRTARAVHELGYDVLVELSTLSIKKRGEPALSYVREALRRGRHVVSANKGPVAFAYNELKELAGSKGCFFLHESAVMDGAPVFDLAEAALKGCRVTALTGILNSTTNFVLSRMEQGEPLDQAVRTAQEKGFAEADPSLDLEGWDAAAKLTILANSLMGAALTPLQVERQGIMEVTYSQVQQARGAGGRLKLLCRAWREGEEVRCRVAPEQVPLGHPLASGQGNGAALRIETDLMAPIYIIQENPTLYDTAYGVINDLLTISEKIK